MCSEISVRYRTASSQDLMLEVGAQRRERSTGLCYLVARQDFVVNDDMAWQLVLAMSPGLRLISQGELVEICLYILHPHRLMRTHSSRLSLWTITTQTTTIAHMHPPSPPTLETAAVHDVIGSAFQSSAPLESLTMTATSLMFSIATAAASQTSSHLLPPTSTPSTTMSDDEGSGECKLLGPFAILVQAALGALALLSLVFKRWRERPQRPLKVWSFDVSKQVVGSILLHLLNLLQSMFSSGQIGESFVMAAASTLGAAATPKYQPNPCSFYLLNLAIDTTVGIPILITMLKILTVGASYTPLARPPASIESGHYGTPPKAGWWAKQCLIYFIGLILMKICVFIIFQLCPWLGRVGDWALRWTEGNEAVQIAFVMFIFPLIMNALQYYIIDIFIKQKIGPQLEGEEDTGHEGAEEHGPLLSEESPEHGPSINDDEACKATSASSSPKHSDQLERIISYESDKDGEEVPDRQQGESSSSPTEAAQDEGIENRPRI